MLSVGSILGRATGVNGGDKRGKEGVKMLSHSLNLGKDKLQIGKMYLPCILVPPPKD